MTKIITVDSFPYADNRTISFEFFNVEAKYHLKINEDLSKTIERFEFKIYGTNGEDYTSYIKRIDNELYGLIESEVECRSFHATNG